MNIRGFFLLTVFQGACLAAPAEVWECTEYYGSKVLVTAVVNEGRKTGTISVAGITYETLFWIKGFDRRWDFELGDDGYYQYAFVVSPGGAGKYYDFGPEHTASSSYSMKCRQR